MLNTLSDRVSDRFTAGKKPLIAAGLTAAAVSAAALAGALAFELIGGYKPCALCLEQRIPYYAAIPLGLLAALSVHMSRKAAAVVLALICVGFLYNAGLGTYHAGAEWHFWPGPDTCEATQDFAKPLGGSLSKSLAANRPVRCDEAALRIAGVSLAGYSVLISVGLAVLIGFALFRSKFWHTQSA